MPFLSTVFGLQSIFTQNFSMPVWQPFDRMANIVDPDQIAPAGAVWSRSTMLAQIYLFEYLA